MPVAYVRAVLPLLDYPPFIALDQVLRSGHRNHSSGGDVAALLRRRPSPFPLPPAFPKLPLFFVVVFFGARLGAGKAGEVV